MSELEQQTEEAAGWLNVLESIRVVVPHEYVITELQIVVIVVLWKYFCIKNQVYF
jgi:hypothetical protein